jgi:hypothetical protein
MKNGVGIAPNDYEWFHWMMKNRPQIIREEERIMENQTHLNAVGEITEMIYKATHKEEE